MVADLEQRKRFMELIGEGLTRRIRVTVLSILALAGIVLQRLLYWYAAQMANEEWGAAGVQVWAFAASAWIVTVGLLLALLRQRLKDMQEGAFLYG